MGIIYSDVVKNSVCEMYINGREYTEIAEEVGIHPYTIWGWLTDRKLIRAPQLRWTKSEEELLQEMWFNNMLVGEITKYFPNRSYQAIVLKANRLGLQRDVHPRSVLDFAKIDTVIKAYLLGFIAADGFVVYRSDKSKYLGITLSTKDNSHLVKIKNVLCPDSKILGHKDSCGGKKTGLTSCSLRVYGLDLCNALEGWGIVPNKSLILKPPKGLSDRFVSHWVRGYFDGDGSIGAYQSSKGKKKGTGNFYCLVSFCGTFGVLDWIHKKYNELTRQKEIVNICPIGKKSYQLQYRGKRGHRFLSWMYGGATIYMDRKYQKALSFL